MNHSANVEETVIKILTEEKKGENYKTVLRVVEYTVNGKQYAPKLEKRTLSKNQHGQWFAQKRSALDFADVKFIAENAPEIAEVMTGIPNKKDKVPF